MTGSSDCLSPHGLPLVVVGGWGVDAAMLQPALAGWPGAVHYVSLTDEGLAPCASISEVAELLIRRFPDPAIWLGWSQGAQVVMAAADRPGTPVDRVITLAGFPRFVACDGWPCGMAPETFRAFEEGVNSNAGRTWRRFQQLLIRGCPRNDATEARNELMPWIAKGPLASGERLQQGLSWLSVEDQRQLWSRIEQPVLHLIGEADALVSPWYDHVNLPEGSIARAVHGMTHWPRGKQAHECGQAMAEFAALSKLSTLSALTTSAKEAS